MTTLLITGLFIALGSTSLYGEVIGLAMMALALPEIQYE